KARRNSTSELVAFTVRPSLRPRSKTMSGQLRTTGISRSFEAVRAVREVSLEIHRHEVIGLIGPNGAGKSTLINLITGFTRPDGGGVTIGDQDVTGWGPTRLAKHGVSRTFQHGHVF